MLHRLIKRSRLLIVVAAVAAASVLFSCNAVEEPTGPTLTFNYPHPDGAEWVYAHNSVGFARYAIDGTYEHPAAGRTQRLYEYIPGPGGWEESFVYYLQATSDSVKIYVDDEANQFIVLLKFPLTEGGSWDAGLGLRATFVDVEEVSVIAGTFKCARVAYTNGSDTFTVWWASDVGGWGARNHGWWAAGGEPILIELASHDLPT